MDEDANIKDEFKPNVIIDAIMAKKNINTDIDDAPIVIAVGPGFCAGKDCDYVIETKRGHFLGRVIENGEAIKIRACRGISAVIRQSVLSVQTVQVSLNRRLKSATV